MRAGDVMHGVMGTVAVEAAVAEDPPGLHVGEDVLDVGRGPACGTCSALLPGCGTSVWPLLRGCGMTSSVPGWLSSAVVRVLPTAALGSGFLQCLAVVAVPGERPAATTTRRVSASITTWWLVEYL